MLHLRRHRRSHRKKHPHHRLLAGHIKLPPHPVLRPHRTKRRTTPHFRLQPVHLGHPLRRRNIQKKIHRSNLFRLRLIPMLPQIHKMPARLGQHRRRRQLPLLQPARLQQHIPRLADRLSRSRIRQVRHRKHRYAIIRQPHHVRPKPRQPAAMPHNMLKPAIGRHPQSKSIS